MKIFTTKQIAEIDQFTIQNEPIADIDLMERASLQIANWLIFNISNEEKLIFFAGPGNNGGDALAIARLMAEHDFDCELYLLDFGKPLGENSVTNWKRLEDQGRVKLFVIHAEEDIPQLSNDVAIIDGLFGSGLSRSLDGLSLKVVEKMNQSGAMVLSIDIPSGLFGEDNSKNDLSKIVIADHTLTFQFPKLSFFFAEHEQLLGEWEVLPIGLHPGAIAKFETIYHFLNTEFVASKMQTRSKFSHKGTFGHALLIAGSYGKVGAAVLASKASLRSGVGLLTTHIPRTGYEIIQTTVPEAMCSIDRSDLMFTEFPDLVSFTAVGVGPGLGMKINTQRALKELLLAKPEKIVLDADALNILAENKDWLELLPENCILTPHPKEFERLAGASNDSFSRMKLQMAFSEKYKVIVVLKGAHTSISLPDGRIYFNTTGNPGMATAGSGDVLTGIILGFLAQDYSPEEAAMISVYLHGIAGDISAEVHSDIATIAGDLVDYLGEAILQVQNN